MGYTAWPEPKRWTDPPQPPEPPEEERQLTRPEARVSPREETPMIIKFVIHPKMDSKERDIEISFPNKRAARKFMIGMGYENLDHTRHWHHPETGRRAEEIIE